MMSAPTSAEFRGRQVDNVDDKRRAIVGAAGLERGRDQRARGIVGRRARAQNVGDVIGRQIAVHAVAAQQKAIVQRHRLRGVVEPHLGLDAERAVENVRPAAATLAHMIDGQERQAVAAQPVGARIADMKHMRDAPAQDQRGEGASHAGEIVVALGERIDPAVERIEDGRRCAAHFHGLGQIAKAVEKAAHRGLGGDAAAFSAADAVGDRRNNVAARLGQFLAEDGAAEILVALARPGLRREADGGLDGRQ